MSVKAILPSFKFQLPSAVVSTPLNPWTHSTTATSTPFCRQDLPRCVDDSTLTILQFPRASGEMAPKKKVAKKKSRAANRARAFEEEDNPYSMLIVRPAGSKPGDRPWRICLSHALRYHGDGDNPSALQLRVGTQSPDGNIDPADSARYVARLNFPAQRADVARVNLPARRWIGFLQGATAASQVLAVVITGAMLLRLGRPGATLRLPSLL